MRFSSFFLGVLTILFAAPALADVTYRNVSAVNLPTGSLTGNSMDARPADLDGDKDLDLVIACEFCPNTILINDGNGFFTDESAARIAQPSHDSEDIGIADFDLDGDLDIVFVSEDDQTNELYLNDGLGFFTDVSGRLTVTGTSNAVLVALVNNDTIPDIIIGNAGQNVVLINDGTGHFVDETSLRLPANGNITQDLEWGDVDGDGDNDLIEGNENGNRLLLNDGSGFFTDVTSAQFPLPGAGEETREADLGDVDGDMDPDLFLANVTFSQGRPAQNRLLLNDGNGFFTDVTSTHLPAELENTVDGDFVDLDYDGDNDLITAQAFVGTYRIYLNDGTGHFVDMTDSLFQTLPTGNGVDIEAADFSGDGLLDLYLTGFQQADYLYLGEGKITGVTGDTEPSGNFELFQNYPNPFNPSTTITYEIGTRGPVTLKLYDVVGREIAILVNDVRDSGRHRVYWDATGQPSGLYILQLQQGDNIRSNKLILTK